MPLCDSVVELKGTRTGGAKAVIFHKGLWGILRRHSQKKLFEVETGMSFKAVHELSPEISGDDFRALEERVYRTIELLKAAREAKVAAERDVARLREQLEMREEEIEGLRKDMVGLRREREEVRTRIEKIMRQIDELTAQESGS